jgi:hypothetical protein
MKVYEFGAEHEKCFVFFQCAADSAAKPAVRHQFARKIYHLIVPYDWIAVIDVFYRK